MDTDEINARLTDIQIKLENAKHSIETLRRDLAATGMLRVINGVPVHNMPPEDPEGVV